MSSKFSSNLSSNNGRVDDSASEQIEEITETKKGLQLFQFSDLDRWDAWVNKIQTFRSIIC